MNVRIPVVARLGTASGSRILVKLCIRCNTNTKLHQNSATTRRAQPGDDRDSYVHLLLERIPVCAVVHARSRAPDGSSCDCTFSRTVPGALGTDPSRSCRRHGASSSYGSGFPEKDCTGTYCGGCEGMRTSTATERDPRCQRHRSELRGTTLSTCCSSDLTTMLLTSRIPFSLRFRSVCS